MLVPGMVAEIAAAHDWNFQNIILVQQNIPVKQQVPCVTLVNTADFPGLFKEFNLEHDPEADRWTSGSKYVWRNHVMNHLCGAKVSTADYLLFSDNDCTMNKSEKASWVGVAIECLEKYPDVLLVCPDEGGHECLEKVPEGRKVQTCSQQLFLIKRETFLNLDFCVPFDGSVFEDDPALRKSTKKAPFDPFRQFYYCLEGRIWRYMDKYQKRRLILNPDWRYTHWWGQIGGKPPQL